MESIAPLNAVTNNTGKVRRDSMTKSMAAAPLFLQRSTNGRYTPTPATQVDDGERSGSGDASNLDSSLGPFRRRPTSPLSGSSYQSMTISSCSNSRPGTPSNVIWTPNASLNGHGRRPSHVRTLSLTSDGEIDYHGTFGIHARPGGPRVLRSPPPEQEPGRRTQSPLVYNASPTKDQSPPNSLGALEQSSANVKVLHNLHLFNPLHERRRLPRLSNARPRRPRSAKGFQGKTSPPHHSISAPSLA